MKTNRSQNKTRTSAAASQSAAANNPQTDLPSHDEIAKKAYSIYLSRGVLWGEDVQHWLQAEAELSIERKRNRV